MAVYVQKRRMESCLMMEDNIIKGFGVQAGFSIKQPNEKDYNWHINNLMDCVDSVLAKNSAQAMTNLSQSRNAFESFGVQEPHAAIDRIEMDGPSIVGGLQKEIIKSQADEISQLKQRIQELEEELKGWRAS